MANPQSRSQFKEYIFRRMGYPLQPIAVDDDQADDRIDDAISFYRDYHYDGTERVLYCHQLTEQDIQNTYVTIPDRIMSVLRVVPVSGTSSGSSLLSTQFQFTANQVLSFNSMGGGSMITYHLAMSYLNELAYTFDTTPGIQFNKNTNKVNPRMNWGLVSPGQYLVFDAYAYLEEKDYSDIWSDRWLKEYAFQLMKRQHGENLKLTGNIQLMGGITVNGEQIWQEANEKIQLMEDQAVSKISGPLEDEIG